MTPREQADAIAAAVCAEWGVTMDMIRGPSRTPAVSIPRQVLCEQLRFRTIMSLAEIGDYVNRDHTSVLYSVRQMAERRDTVNRIANVEARLGDAPNYAGRSGNPARPGERHEPERMPTQCGPPRVPASAGRGVSHNERSE